ERVVACVDAYAALGRVVRALLTSAGVLVVPFESSAAFLEAAGRDSIGCGCVVLDVRMAGTSGLDLMRHLVAAGSRIPVVMLTAHADEETRRRSLEAGAVAFLEKPVRSAALLDAVRTALSSV